MDKKSPYVLKPGQLKRLLDIAKEGNSKDMEAEFQKAGIGKDKVSGLLPDWIGRYKILSVLGEGGMGIVYLARQEHPIERTVAVKVIKPGMDSKQVIARFEAERQALALLDHPHIARVLDAGTTDAGRPYFVMEYVKGLAITRHCDQKKLTINERLSLFLQVCAGIQHAHRKGIIHRDIKPSNILVSVEDGKAVPKVIDFGVAKALAQPLSERTFNTMDGQFVGTPEYMSPEQAELNDLEIDIRTDIYSLGILLYELLTGTPPFSEEELRKAGYIEMQRIICQEEPDKPSTKLTTLGEKLTDIAEHRDSAPDVLAKAVRGDLDWIVMKSIEKDRSRRYETADDFAGDIQRHLNDEPVLARPPEFIYRLRKFVRRHRLQTAAVLMLALLAVAVVISLSIWSQYRHQVKESESFTHRQTLARARKSLLERDFLAALRDAESILDSRHVGLEAQLLYAGILIESNEPNEAVVRLKNLLNERPEIAGAARSLLDRINLEVELVEADRPVRVILPVGKTIYVDANAAGTNDGSNWDNAYKYLQDALAAASRGDVIKVAEGVYKPDQGAAVTPGDREATFQLKSGVAIYGGINGGKSILSGDLNGNDGPDFAGNEENSYHVVRAKQADETAVLDGFTITAGNANGEIFSDQARGGGISCRPGSPMVTNCLFSKNTAQHGGGMFNEFKANPTLTKCNFRENKAYVDGGGIFNQSESCPTITDCNFIDNSAVEGGGGMKNDNHSNPTVINCVFKGNLAKEHGGGIRNREHSNPMVTNCTFISNSARVGGGIFNRAGSPTVTNCTFNSNIASGGGGMGNEGDSNPEVINCTFTDNSAQRDGGGMRNWSSSTIKDCIFTRNSAGETGGGISNSSCSPLVKDCIFTRNSAKEGGAIYNNTDDNLPEVTNCKFIENYAQDNGGAIRNYGSSPVVTNCTFVDNSAGKEGGGMINIGSNPLVEDCIFSGNTTSVGGGMLNGSSSNPTVTNCTFTGNSAQDDGGGMRNNWNSSPTVTNCTFIENSANDDGGGMINDVNSSPIVTNSNFIANSAQNNAGGMLNIRSSNPKLINCVFSGNSVNKKGGGIFNQFDCELMITNCTFSSNSSNKGSAIYSDKNCSSRLSNCILWGNTAGKRPQIALEENSSMTVNYCNLQGGLPEITIEDPNSSVTGGPGNIDTNPLFVNAANADYYLRTGSPCIDAGDNSALPESVAVDLDRNPRIINGKVDMGALEYSRLLLPHMRAGNPSPADGAKDVTPTAILQWSAGAEAQKHDLYFGTNGETVRSAGMRSPEYKGTKGLGFESYGSAELRSGTTYYWRVDEYNTDAMVSKGRVWSFTVADETVEQTAPIRKEVEPEQEK